MLAQGQTYNCNKSSQNRQDSKADYLNAFSPSLLFLLSTLFNCREKNCTYSYYFDQVLYLLDLSMSELYSNAISLSQASVQVYLLCHLF